jgi:hypothetical protein
MECDTEYFSDAWSVFCAKLTVKGKQLGTVTILIDTLCVDELQ